MSGPRVRSPVARRASCTLGALLALVACAGGEAPADASSSAASSAPSAEGAPAAAEVQDAPAPAGAGTVSMVLRGQGVDVTGDGPAGRCASPAYLPPAEVKGLYYEGSVQGYTVAMGDMEQRRAGAQRLLRAGGTGWEGTVNGPGKSYAILRERPSTIRVSDDFKTAEMRATVKPIGEPNEYTLEVTFRCR